MGLPAEDFDIVGSYNNQRIAEIDGERSVNCFEYRDPLSKKKKSLIGTSGLLPPAFVFPSVPSTSGFRAQFVFLGTQYIVIGAYVFLITPANVVTLLYSSLFRTTGYVAIDGNEFQVLFVDGNNGYIYDTVSGVFAIITDPAFPVAPIDCCVLDEYFVVADGGTNNFQLSSFNQGLIWGPDFTTGIGNTFVATSGSSPNLVLTSGSTLNYQVGTPIQFTVTGGGALPTSSPPLNQTSVYYIKSVVNSTTFTISATDGGTPILFTSTGTATITLTNSGQLQLGSITTHSGHIQACRTLHRRLFLFSDFYTEVWENAGLGTNLPFRRNNSALIEYGTPCLGSIAVSFDRMLFISQTRDGIGPVMEIEGVQALEVSTRALNSQLATYSRLNQISDCRAFLIQENGLIFYRMNFTAANHTFVYNVSLSDPSGGDPEKLWHEEEDLHENRHWTQTHAYFNGKNYSGDYRNPNMYEVSATEYSNNGENIPRMRITRPFMNPGSNRRRVDRLFMDFLQGNVNDQDFETIDQDLATENGFLILTESGFPLLLEQQLFLNNLPEVYLFLSISKDTGQSYGLTQQLPFGAIGQRTFRTLARKLGVTPRGQAFVCKIQFYAMLPFNCFGASWVTEVLPE